MLTALYVGDRHISRSPRQQLLATVIFTASQIQMENRSHSAALLIMYGRGRAARLWTTGGRSHVSMKPFGYVLGITRVLVIYKAPLFSSQLARLQNVHPISFNRCGLSQLCPLCTSSV